MTKIMRLKSLLICGLILCGVFGRPILTQAVAEEHDRADGQTSVEVKAFVDKSTITIGEKVRYTVDVVADENIEITLPPYAAHLGGFAVRDFGREDPKAFGRGKVKRSHWYLLDTYTVGSYVIPPMDIRAVLPDTSAKVLKTPNIFVEVKSVVEEGDAHQGLRDIKSPLNIERQVPLWLSVLIVMMLLGLGGGLAWYEYVKRHMRKAPPPPRSAHDIAFEELNRIEGLDLIAKREIKEYYFLISACLRNYLEGRFRLKAPEQTTEEFLASVMENQVLDGKYINIIKEYLEHCDLVKFAKYDPPAEDVSKIMDTTRRFIDETKIASYDEIDNEPAAAEGVSK